MGKGKRDKTMKLFSKRKENTGNTNEKRKGKDIFLKISYISQIAALFSFAIAIPEAYIQREYRFMAILIFGAVMMVIPLIFMASVKEDHEDGKVNDGVVENEKS